jgi:hypothetical protein
MHVVLVNIGLSVPTCLRVLRSRSRSHEANVLELGEDVAEVCCYLAGHAVDFGDEYAKLT